MRITKQILTLSACAAAWMGSAAQAEEQAKPFTRNMSETAAPFIKPTSSVTVGAGYMKGNREQFGIFDNQRGAGGRGILDANINLRDEETGAWSKAKIYHLGLDDQEAKVDYNKQGEWGVSLGYVQTPRIAPYTTVTNIQGLGTSALKMPATSNNGTGPEFQIGTQRDRLNVETFRFLNKELKVNLALKNEKKEGTRHWGRGSAAEFAAEPIDWNTRQLDSSLSYMGKNTQLSGGYNGSWFENSSSLVDIIRQGDNPATVGNHTYLSVPLDNEAHQLYFQGGHHFTPTTRGTFKLAYTRALQNDPLDTANIPTLAAGPAPSSLNGRVDTTLATVGLTAQPLDKLQVVSNLRYFNEQDKTPEWLIVTGATEVRTTPISNKTLSGKLEGTYRLPFHTSVTTGVERKNQDRKIPFGNDNNKDGLDDERFVPFRTDLDETTYLLQLRRNLSDTLNGSISYQHAEREGSKFTNSTKIMGNSQGKISPFFIADRTREKVRGALDWNPLKSLDLQFTVENAHDTYEPDSQPYGRRKGEARLYSVDLDYAFTSKLLLNAWYSHDFNEIWQSTGRWDGNLTHEADKNSFLKDTGDSIGLGLRNQFTSNLKLGSNVQWTETISRYSTRVLVDPDNAGNDPAQPIGSTPLPDIRSTDTKFNTFVEYANLGPGMLRFDYVHERWQTNDWTWQFSDGAPFSYGTTMDGTMIVTREHQSSNFFALRYTTKF